MIQSRSIQVPDALDGQRFDVALSELLPDISRKKIKQIIDAGGAYLNKKRVVIAKFMIKKGDKIEIFWDDVRPLSNKSHAYKLESSTLIFEHPNFFVVNKPAGIPVQATLISSTDTFFYALQHMDPNKFKISEMFLVHRLDKDTSGVMLIAKNKIWQRKFEELFFDKKMKKTYDALCFQFPKEPNGKIDFAIAKDQTKKNQYQAILNKDSKIKDQKTAITMYSLIRNYQSEASHVRCFPLTGRTHQIRVHLAAIGCPVLGDKTYAQNIYGNRFRQVALRQMLHASQIEFEMDGIAYKFEAPLANDFIAVVQQLEGSLRN